MAQAARTRGVGLNCGTAYAALHHRARVRPGETILIHAAAGGAGTASGAKHGYLRAQACITQSTNGRRIGPPQQSPPSWPRTARTCHLRTRDMLAAHATPAAVMASGFRLALPASSIFLATAAVIALRTRRPGRPVRPEPTAFNA